MNDLVNALLVTFGLVVCWLLFYFGWRPYRIDKVRMEFFKLRNELFIFAAEGGISFEEPAYRTMRDRLNAVIRHAHIITVTRALIFIAAEHFSPNEYAVGLSQNWLQAISRLPESSQAKIKSINDRMAFVTAVQMITGNPLVFLVVGMWVVAMLIVRRMGRAPVEGVRLRVAKELHVELIEEQAMLAQTHEREMQAYELAHT